MLASQWVVQAIEVIHLSTNLVGYFIPSILATLILLGAATIITAAAKGLGQIVWLTVLGVISALNALAFAAVLR